MRRVFSKTKEFISKYERHISAGALLGGFIIDALTLRRIDRLFENLVLIGYLSIVTIGILIMNLYEGGQLQNKVFERLHTFLPFVIQFAFGALFSGFLVFYFKSASLLSSWPFILLLIGLFIGNETFKKLYERTVFNLSVLFLSYFLFAIFYVPLKMGKLGNSIFIMSGIASLVAISIVVAVLAKYTEARVNSFKKLLVLSITGIFVAMNMLYFTNIIPPIPLSLKQTGVYHFVGLTNKGYVATQELHADERPFYTRAVIHVVPGKPVYFFSAIFGPNNLSTNVVHHWRIFDESRQSWVTKSKIPFTITGGRDSGFRGYTYKTSTQPGLWEVRVETERGQVIGRQKFDIVHVPVATSTEQYIVFD
jgi:hypothetical protein